MSELLREALFTTPEMEATVGDRAWLGRMLAFEAGLARAQAAAGLIPAVAAEAIGDACRLERLDLSGMVQGTARGGNPAIPLVRALTAAVPGEAAGYVHWGATSQDVVDTATMLLLRDALALLDRELARLLGACATLARDHRGTVMAGRTLMQQALPVTFGLKAAGWYAQLARVRGELARVRAEVPTVQLGGAAGTLASLDRAGVEVLERLAAELGLAAPELPWHTARDRVARVFGALGLLGGALGKLARDVVLLMRTELGEAVEPLPEGAGGSSTMPHKRNPVGCTAVLAAVQRLHALLPVGYGAMLQEHERAAGAWHAEWEPLREALRLAAAALARSADIAAGLQVDPARMRENVQRSGGLMLAEAVMMALAPSLGRGEAHHRVEGACRQAVDEGRPLLEVLAADPAVTAVLDRERLAALLAPEGYLGVADAFIERALAR